MLDTFIGHSMYNICQGRLFQPALTCPSRRSDVSELETIQQTGVMVLFMASKSHDSKSASKPIRPDQRCVAVTRTTNGLCHHLTKSTTGQADSPPQFRNLLIPAHVRRHPLHSSPRPQAAFCPNVNAATKEQKPFSRSAAKQECVMTLGSIEHL